MFTLCLEYCKDNPALTIVLLALGVFLLLVLFTIAVLSIKAHAAKKRLRAETSVMEEDNTNIKGNVETEEHSQASSPIASEISLDKTHTQTEPIAKEEPVADIKEEIADEPSVDEEPLVEIEEEIADEPIVVDEPVVETKEEIANEPIVDDELAVEIEEAIANEPIVDDELAVEIEEAIANEPIVDEEPVIEIEEKTADEPIVDEEPVVEIKEEIADEPIADDEPVVEIKEEIADEPIVDEEPVVEIKEEIADEPIVNEEPVVEIEKEIAAPVHREFHTSPKRIQPETRKKLTAEQREAFRQQLVEKIVERLGQNRVTPKKESSAPSVQPEKSKNEPPVEIKEPTPITPPKATTISPISSAPVFETAQTAKENTVQPTQNDDVQIDLFNDRNVWDQTPKTLLDELKDVDTRLDFYEEDEIDQQARHCGKWVIYRVITEDRTPTEEELYFFELHAANGEKLLSGEEYPTYASALRGIETHKANILRDNFKILTSPKGEYFFKLRTGKNLLLCVSETYATKRQCEEAIRLIKRFAKIAIVDENLEDHIVNVPMEETSPFPAPTPIDGKWIISGTEGENGEMIYAFHLFTEDGEKLLSSEEYMTYIGAVNGIQTYKTNIAQGNFRITLTKFGDYIYKLLNKNGQLLCLGEHYKTKQRCAYAVETICQAAKNAPVLSDPKLVEQTEQANAK